MIFLIVQTDLACFLPNLPENLSELLKFNIEDELT